MKLIFDFSSWTRTFLSIVVAMGFSVPGHGGHSQRQMIEDSLRASLDANANAVDYAQWRSSGQLPEQVFRRLRRAHVDGALFCEVLGSLTDSELSFFEDAIANSLEMLNTCSTQILVRIDAYWQHQREAMDTEEDIQFETIKLERDIKVGPRYVSGDVRDGEVLLTFDDGPHPAHTQPLLDSLNAVGAMATFFVLGRNAKTHPSILRSVADGGHRIGSHSYKHDKLPSFTYEAAINDMKKGHKAVFEVLGWADPFFRFPYGASNERLRAFVKHSQVADFFWHIDTEDWNRRKVPDAPALVRKLMDELSKKRKGIILFHDIQRVTREAMPQILRELYKENYRPAIIVPMDEDSRYRHSWLDNKNQPLP